ncbi:MAG: 3-keto-5-aminohexanoate cleavage protein [Ahrensia sp.]|nr:3-keto-5-aminohexanoate cleavage protein [Ahrensia sp.]
MGVEKAMPVDREVFEFYIQTINRLFGAIAPWCAAGIGAERLTLNKWAVSSGGHARTGLEDNVRLDRDTLSPSNAVLNRHLTELCEKYEWPVASWTEARRILGLKEIGSMKKIYANARFGRCPTATIKEALLCDLGPVRCAVTEVPH